jgi:hypothetical protein
LQAGVLKLVGADPEKIINETTRLLEDEAAYARMAQAPISLGMESGRPIVDALVTFTDTPFNPCSNAFRILNVTKKICILPPHLGLGGPLLFRRV